MAASRARLPSSRPALVAALPLLAGCAMHVGSSSSVLQAREPVALGEDGSDLRAGLRGYELGFQVQVPYAVTLLGASANVGEARALGVGALEDGQLAPLVRTADVGSWQAMVGLAVPLPAVKGVRLAPYGSWSHRLLPMDEPSIVTTTELGLQILPREPWGFFGDELRQGFAARVGICWAKGQFGDEEWENPPFTARGLLFAIDYRLLFSDVEKWEL
ncbi:MAG: hypothetical protein ABIO70_11645 [Pseudomonadota bacterium]